MDFDRRDIKKTIEISCSVEKEKNYGKQAETDHQMEKTLVLNRNEENTTVEYHDEGDDGEECNTDDAEDISLTTTVTYQSEPVTLNMEKVNKQVPRQLRLSGGASCESLSVLSLMSSSSNTAVSIELRPRNEGNHTDVLRLQCKSLPRLTNHCDCSEKDFILPVATTSTPQILEMSTCPFKNYQLKAKNEPIKKATLWGGGQYCVDPNYQGNVTGNPIPSLQTPPPGTAANFGPGTTKYSSLAPKMKKRKYQSDVLEDIQSELNEWEPPCARDDDQWATPPQYRQQYMERTPPIFSRNPRVAQLGSQLKYEAKDFGVDQFQQWTDADQYLKYAPREMEDVDDVVPREKREKVQRTCEAMYIEEGQEKQQPSGFQLPPHLRKRLEQTKSFKYSKPRGERGQSAAAPPVQLPQIEEGPPEYTCAPMYQDDYTEKLKKRAMRDAKKREKKEKELQKQREAEQKAQEEELRKQQKASQREEFAMRAAARKAAAMGEVAADDAVQAAQLAVDQARAATEAAADAAAAEEEVKKKGKKKGGAAAKKGGCPRKTAADKGQAAAENAMQAAQLAVEQARAATEAAAEAAAAEEEEKTMQAASRTNISSGISGISQKKATPARSRLPCRKKMTAAEANQETLNELDRLDEEASRLAMLRAMEEEDREIAAFVESARASGLIGPETLNMPPQPEDEDIYEEAGNVSAMPVAVQQDPLQMDAYGNLDGMGDVCDLDQPADDVGAMAPDPFQMDAYGNLDNVAPDLIGEDVCDLDAPADVYTQDPGAGQLDYDPFADDEGPMGKIPVSMQQTAPIYELPNEDILPDTGALPDEYGLATIAEDASCPMEFSQPAQVNQEALDEIDKLEKEADRLTYEAMLKAMEEEDREIAAFVAQAQAAGVVRGKPGKGLPKPYFGRRRDRTPTCKRPGPPVAKRPGPPSATKAPSARRPPVTATPQRPRRPAVPPTTVKKPPSFRPPPSAVAQRGATPQTVRGRPRVQGPAVRPGGIAQAGEVCRLPRPGMSRIPSTMASGLTSAATSRLPIMGASGVSSTAPPIITTPGSPPTQMPPPQSTAPCPIGRGRGKSGLRPPGFTGIGRTPTVGPPGEITVSAQPASSDTEQDQNIVVAATSTATTSHVDVATEGAPAQIEVTISPPAPPPPPPCPPPQPPKTRGIPRPGGACALRQKPPLAITDAPCRLPAREPQPAAAAGAAPCRLPTRGIPQPAATAGAAPCQLPTRGIPQPSAPAGAAPCRLPTRGIPQPAATAGAAPCRLPTRGIPQPAATAEAAPCRLPARGIPQPSAGSRIPPPGSRIGAPTAVRGRGIPTFGRGGIPTRGRGIPALRTSPRAPSPVAGPSSAPSPGRPTSPVAAPYTSPVAGPSRAPSPGRPTSPVAAPYTSPVAGPSRAPSPGRPTSPAAAPVAGPSRAPSPGPCPGPAPCAAPAAGGVCKLPRAGGRGRGRGIPKPTGGPTEQSRMKLPLVDGMTVSQRILKKIDDEYRERDEEFYAQMYLDDAAEENALFNTWVEKPWTSRYFPHSMLRFSPRRYDPYRYHMTLSPKAKKIYEEEFKQNVPKTPEKWSFDENLATPPELKTPQRLKVPEVNYRPEIMTEEEMIEKLPPGFQFTPQEVCEREPEVYPESPEPYEGWSENLTTPPELLLPPRLYDQEKIEPNFNPRLMTEEEMEKSFKTPPRPPSGFAFNMEPMSEEGDPQKLVVKSDAKKGKSTINILAEGPPSKVNISIDIPAKPDLPPDFKEQLPLSIRGSPESPGSPQAGFMSQMAREFPSERPSRASMQLFTGKKMRPLRGSQRPKAGRIQESPLENFPAYLDGTFGAPMQDVCELPARSPQVQAQGSPQRRPPSPQAAPPGGLGDMSILPEDDEVCPMGDESWLPSADWRPPVAAPTVPLPVEQVSGWAPPSKYQPPSSWTQPGGPDQCAFEEDPLGLSDQSNWVPSAGQPLPGEEIFDSIDGGEMIGDEAPLMVSPGYDDPDVCPAPRRMLPRPSGLRPPQASGLRPPQASGLRPPQASGLRPPQAAGLRPPQASGLRPPQASGLRPPQASGLRPPQTSGLRPPQASGLMPPQASGLIQPQGQCLRAPQAAGLRPPQASGLRPPQASGLRSPQASGIRSPQASGLRPPQASGLRPPQAPGLRPPQASGLRPPQAGQRGRCRRR
ncbi:nascent polypeptide-associated complex subunit alpha, muscle-specific form isoform X2 [Aethina tumida]|uniref:nascent polypeptide-associated complex subunit alpha, muscle-specific form isoform X2 n=1 Tax=Aethina tumida TaxID=116153 RepID=UPI002147C911|nr:nascent polypeptide-associated complex subunit alpha, muscle-specific form isoform X2 [Aethina tumida]